MSPFLDAVLYAIVCAFANVVYVDLRRKGRRRGRLIAFFAGYPWTLISLITVREGSVPTITPPPDDERRLLREIRLDREIRGELGRDEREGGGEREAPPGN